MFPARIAYDKRMKKHSCIIEKADYKKSCKTKADGRKRRDKRQGFLHPPFHECLLDSKEKSTYTLMRCFRPGKSPLQDQAKKAAPGQAKEAAQQLKALKAR